MRDRNKSKIGRLNIRRLISKLRLNQVNSNMLSSKKHIIIFVVCITILVIGAYAGVKQNKQNEDDKIESVDADYSTASTMQPVNENTYMLTPTQYIIQDSFKELLEENQDTVGYIKIENTKIDYPVVQTADNEYYRVHNFNGDDSEAGAIFLDCKCNIKLIEDTGNFVIYGHNMKDDSMFAALMNYKDETFFEQNGIIELNTLYENYEWEIFSVYVTPISFNYLDTTFHTDQSYENYLNTCKDMSMYPNDVIPTINDSILTLSTCTYEFDNARFVVQARLKQ